MISVVIPTLNRGYVLNKTLPSYFSQKNVSEVVIVDDGGSDDTKKVVESVQRMYPDVTAVYLRHESRQGAPKARNYGVQTARNEWILMGEDDAILGPAYADQLLQKIMDKPRYAAAAGRLVQLRPHETTVEAHRRFGNGIVSNPPFRRWTLLFNAEAQFTGNIDVPMLPAVLLARRELLLRYPFQEELGKGNGYREETSFQAEAYGSGYDFLHTNDTHFYHLAHEDVQLGGQRGSLLMTFVHTLVNNHRFLRKNFHCYKTRLSLPFPRPIAELALLSFNFWYSLAKPLLSIYLKKPLLKLVKAGK